MTVDILNAATIGGSKALLRPDLGRLAPGMKADILLIDLECSQMVPVYDPLRSLLFHASDRAVRDVYVDGRLVVHDHKVLTLDEAGAAARLTEAARKMIEAVPSRDYRGRNIHQMCPLCLPMVPGKESGSAI
jgi:cytosine/adenosine deaminase-related metal-dependent hydrolase